MNEVKKASKITGQTVNTLREQGRETMENPWKPMVLLMAEILHQLKLVVYPIIYRVGFFTSQVMQNFFHQQWHWDNQSQKICLFESDFQKKNSNHQSLVSCAREVELHTNKRTQESLLYYRPKQCTIIFGKLPQNHHILQVFVSSLIPPQMGAFFFHWNPNPNIPKATSGSKDKETTILEPAAESWGWWWIQRLTSNKTLGI